MSASVLGVLTIGEVRGEKGRAGPPAFAPRPSSPWFAPWSSAPSRRRGAWAPQPAWLPRRFGDASDACECRLKGCQHARVRCVCAVRATARALRGNTAFVLAEVRYLDAAALWGHDALSAARLRIGGWLGLDDGLVEQNRLDLRLWLLGLRLLDSLLSLRLLRLLLRDHGAYTHWRESSSALHAHEPCICTAVALRVHCAVCRRSRLESGEGGLGIGSGNARKGGYGRTSRGA